MIGRGTTAQWPLQVALHAACVADAALAAAVGTEASTGAARVFSDAAPVGCPLPYVVLGDASESGAPTFGRMGHEGALTVHVWARDREDAAVLHGHLARVLDRQRLTPAGHAHLTGRLALVSSFDDPDGGAHHRVLRYETRTRAGSAA